MALESTKVNVIRLATHVDKVAGTAQSPQMTDLNGKALFFKAVSRIMLQKALVRLNAFNLFAILACASLTNLETGEVTDETYCEYIGGIKEGKLTEY